METVSYVLEHEIEVLEFLRTLLIPLFFIIFGVIGFISTTKRVEVCKGKIIYHNGLKNKEYRMSDIKTSKTQIETYNIGFLFADTSSIESYDIITAFYDKTGKKLFQFGLGYNNVERLKEEVKNTQKSISGQRIKK